MELTLSKDVIDFARLIPMGQFFMYEVCPEGYIVHSADNICKIEIGKEESILISDNIEFWKNYFSLNDDYDRINKDLLYHCINYGDSYGESCIKEGKGLRLCKQPYLETCIEYLLSAQNNIARIRKSMFKILSYGSSKTDISTGMTFNSFPTMNQLLKMSEDDFIQCGAGFRSKYIVEFINNYKRPPIHETEENIIKFLMNYKGIGPKVASCIALYALNQKNSFPIDVWIQKVLDEKYKDKTFVKPFRNAGILQVYMYEKIRGEK